MLQRFKFLRYFGISGNNFGEEGVEFVEQMMSDINKLEYLTPLEYDHMT